MAIDGRVTQLEASERIDSQVQLTYVEAAGETDFLRRALNFSVAAVALAITTPLMMGIALTIRLTSRRGALFTQTRIGWDRRRSRDRRRAGRSPAPSRRQSDLGGQPFTIYKFRTMRDGPVKAEVWATPDDPRITPLGRVLRQYRLDELPQLVNVLRGDMNLVGPRPEQPSIFAALRDQIPGYHERQRVRPGITGWAQINHPYDRSLDDVQKKLQFDLDYVKRKSASRDLFIMLRTLPVMLFRRGAH